LVKGILDPRRKSGQAKCRSYRQISLMHEGRRRIKREEKFYKH
jgi:hypothetical protein